jgi:hypothetical protein
MLTQEETNRIKSYHAGIASARETITGIIASSEQRTLKERIERAKILRDMQTAAVNKYMAELQKQIEKSGVFRLKKMLRLV